MALRIKAGGPTQVISGAEAKKLGLITKVQAVAAIVSTGVKDKAKQPKEELKKANKENANDNK